ncbi:putative methyltransferase-domain-containing protein [Lenzites betulinus]|nr:putative methyltransferase-domain-containing protein [Lenzites betulinus]
MVHNPTMALDEPPNFPPDLDIHPLASATSDADARFDSAAQEDAIKTYGIAGRIWEASHAMLAYLDPASPLEFDPPPPTVEHDLARSGRAITAIELGSGTGFVAARVAQWLCPERDLLIVSDLPDVCPMLQENLRECRAVQVRPLAWGSPEHVHAISEELLPPDSDKSPTRLTHILCSDLIYFPALLAPLLRSLLQLTSFPFVDETSPEPALVVMSYKMRSLAKETPFWHAFGLWFDFVPVLSRQRAALQTVDVNGAHLWSRFSPGDDADETFVLVAARRPESLRWRIPDDDHKLLAGVGARGSDLPKSDDQFEQLLLMGMDI